MLRVRYLYKQPVFHAPAVSVRGIGLREVMPPCFVSRPSTGDFLVMLFQDAVDFGPPETSARLRPGSLVVWFPGDPHHYGNRRDRWAHSWLHCNGPFVADLLRQAKVPRAAPLHPVNAAAFLEHLLHLHEELTLTPTPDEAVIRSLLHLLVRRTLRSTPARLPLPPGLRRASDLLHTCYAEPLTLRRLADAAGLSVPHFCTLFKRHFGLTPMAQVTRRRMEVAATLLRNTPDPISLIGPRVGYPDPPHFSKAFKSHFGVPPSRLR